MVSRKIGYTSPALISTLGDDGLGFKEVEAG